MSWAFAFEAPHGYTIKSSRFMWVTHFNHAIGLWWSDDLRKWTSIEEIHDNGFVASNGAPCHSYKAFIRHLNKHPELRDVGVITLVSRYQGYNIKAMWLDEDE